MVPAAFRLVDSVPLTTGGKIDRARLSSVPYREIETSPSAEPRTRSERVLARIWEDLLGAEGVGIDSSFLDIGGDSLLSVRCVTLARKAGLNLTVNQLHRTPTIRELAGGEAEAAPHNIASADGLLPVPPVISFWNSLVGFDEHFNIGDLFFLRGGILNIKILDRAFAHVIEKHEGLRLRVARTQDGLRLGIGPCPTERIVEEIDLVRMTGPDQHIYKQLQISARQAEVASNNYLLSIEEAKRATVQATEQQNWKKAELLANQVKDFFSDECVDRTTYMLDWHIRKLIIADDDEKEVLTLHDDAAHAEAQNRPKLRDEFLNEGRAVVMLDLISGARDYVLSEVTVALLTMCANTTFRQQRPSWAVGSTIAKERKKKDQTTNRKLESCLIIRGRLFSQRCPGEHDILPAMRGVKNALDWYRRAFDAAGDA